MSDKLKLKLQDHWYKSHKFTLKAQYLDRSFVRQYGGYALWKQVLKNNAGQFAETDNTKAMYDFILAGNYNGVYDAFPVRVFINDKYNGLYMLQQKSDMKNSNLDEEANPNAFVFGDADANTPQANFDSANVKLDGHDLEKFFPDAEVTQADIDKVANFITETTRENGIADNKNKLFDLSNQVDYVLFMNAIGNIDGDGNNETYYAFDGDTFYSGVYNLDNCLNDKYVEWKGGNKFKRLAMDFDKKFVAERWVILRQSVLSFDNMYATYMAILADIPQEALDEEFDRWKDNPYMDQYGIDTIKPQLERILAFADEYIETNFDT